jgi:hypothetical protein
LAAQPETKEPIMSSAAMHPASSGHSGPGEPQDELRHVQNLVFLRDFLAERGGTPAELKQYDAVIAEAEARLEAVARRKPVRYAAAA